MYNICIIYIYNYIYISVMYPEVEAIKVSPFPPGDGYLTMPYCHCQDRLKLIDFGFSEIIATDDTMLQMPCGTLHYTSPEVLSRNYSSKCDLWRPG